MLEVSINGGCDVAENKPKVNGAPWVSPLRETLVAAGAR